MKQQLKEVLQNFDEQEDIKKRAIIQLIIERAIVHQGINWSFGFVGI